MILTILFFVYIFRNNIEGFGNEAIENIASIYNNGVLKVNKIQCTDSIELGDESNKWYLKPNMPGGDKSFSVGRTRDTWKLQVHDSGQSTYGSMWAKDAITTTSHVDSTNGIKMKNWYLKPSGTYHGDDIAIGRDQNSWLWKLNATGDSAATKSLQIGPYGNDPAYYQLTHVNGKSFRGLGTENVHGLGVLARGTGNLRLLFNNGDNGNMYVKVADQ